MNHRQIINTAAALIPAKLFRRRIPFQVHIGVTQQCNRSCSYCKDFYRSLSQKPPTTTQLFDLIDGCAKLGTKRITLLGGEPLLRQDIDEIITRIKQHGISCSLTTNGSFIDKHLKALKKLDQLSVSIDGDKNTHDVYRGNGSWEKAVKAITLARENKIPVQLLVTITNLAEDRLEHITELADKYDCYIDFNFLSMMDEGTGFRIRPEAAGEEQIRKLMDHFLKNQNPRVVPSPSVLRHFRNWPHFLLLDRLSGDQIPKSCKPIKCAAGRFSAFVDADGRLWPCSLTRSDYKALNVFDLGIEAAWEKMPKSICVACCSGACMFGALFSLEVGTLIHLMRLISRGNYT